MKRLLLALMILLAPMRVALAGAEEDAAFIISGFITEQLLAKPLEAVKPKLIANTRRNFHRSGIDVRDLDRFFDVMFEEFRGVYLEELRALYLPIFLETYSEAELARIAAFQRSEAGRKFRLHMDRLQAAGRDLRGKAVGAAGLGVRKKVHDRLLAEGAEIVSNAATRDKLIRALKD